MLKNTENKYGLVSKGFHWLMAILVITLLAVGLYMEGMERSPLKFEIYGLHKATGVVVLGLVILRVMWKFYSKAPAILGMSKIKVLAAKLGHLALYAFMFIMPFSGWGMSSSYGYPVSFFGLFEMPALLEKNKEVGDLMSGVHEWAGYILIALIVLHVSAALHHHFIAKDDTLKRMT